MNSSSLDLAPTRLEEERAYKEIADYHCCYLAQEYNVNIFKSYKDSSIVLIRNECFDKKCDYSNDELKSLNIKVIE